MFWRFIHIVACISIFFHSIVWVVGILFIHFATFGLLWIVLPCMYMHTFSSELFSFPLGYVRRSGMAGPPGIATASCLRHCHHGCAIFYSHQPFRRVPSSPILANMSVILIIAILEAVKWHLIVGHLPFSPWNHSVIWYRLPWEEGIRVPTEVAPISQRQLSGEEGQLCAVSRPHAHPFIQQTVTEHVGSARHCIRCRGFKAETRA